MDMMSNPGFVRDRAKSKMIYSAIADYLGKHSWMTMINDYTMNSDLYPNAVTLPALPHPLIDTSGMADISDYLERHKNIRTNTRYSKKTEGHFIIYKMSLNLRISKQ